ncbi:hypothetical protein DAEQUDRAFT_724409 [Daedalea quercina L-15889]|uniref:RING-type domain-containing protein n=1 Tax=Daedalea quercina L-15889 TaxID=1314783 RepID=A0A165S1R8_9APHY|nr:hypothetical protein DAEQUDRAFT_724409 [Daedalea quercina L-15889]
MHARCSICQDTLGEANTPMTTLCGHLYCVECATFQFGDQGFCAICREGPYELDALIKLYPDYEPQQSSSPPARELGREMWPDGRTMEAGRSALRACDDVLESDDVFESPALSSALERTDDLIATLEDTEAPGIRSLLSDVTSLLQDIRSKASDASRIPDLEAQRDHLQLMARRLTERIHDLQRSRDSEHEAAAAELENLRQEWTTRVVELQEELHETTSLLNIERAKVDQTRIVIEQLDTEAKKWQTQAARYKKKHHSIKKKHQAMEAGIQDAFFGGDDALEFI